MGEGASIELGLAIARRARGATRARTLCAARRRLVDRRWLADSPAGWLAGGGAACYAYTLSKEEASDTVCDDTAALAHAARYAKHTRWRRHHSASFEQPSARACVQGRGGKT